MESVPEAKPEEDQKPGRQSEEAEGNYRSKIKSDH